MTERMLTAVANPHVDVLGHCTGRMVTGNRKRPESQFDADAVFAACAEHGVAVEVNSRPERLDPPKRLLRRAVEAGCAFTIDTDAHAPGPARLAATTAASGPRRARCRPSGCSTRGRPSGCLRRAPEHDDSRDGNRRLARRKPTTRAPLDPDSGARLEPDSRGGDRDSSGPTLDGMATESVMLALGTPAPPFALPDPATGKIVSLDDFAAAPALVVTFLGNHCPYVQRVAAGLARSGPRPRRAGRRDGRHREQRRRDLPPGRSGRDARRGPPATAGRSPTSSTPPRTSPAPSPPPAHPTRSSSTATAGSSTAGSSTTPARATARR